MPLAKDLLHPSVEEERGKCKLKRLVQSPNSYCEYLMLREIDKRMQMRNLDPKQRTDSVFAVYG